MIQENARVLWNKNIGASYYRIGLTCDRIYSDAKPGQFVMLRLSKSAVPLLRRPFSIHRLIIKNKHIRGSNFFIRWLERALNGSPCIEKGMFWICSVLWGTAFSSGIIFAGY